MHNQKDRLQGYSSASIQTSSKPDSDQGISRFFPEAQNIDYYHSIDIEIMDQSIYALKKH